MPRYIFRGSLMKSLNWTVVGILASMFVAFPTWAQEYGAVAGFHRTTADSNTNGVSVEGKLNFKAGLAVGFELVEKTKFRTGFIFNQRHIDVTSSGVSLGYKFDYIDIPANVQYNFNEMVGVFGGLTIAALVNDKVDGAGSSSVDPKAESLIPILNLGVNFLFDDMIGFDLYYERGMGRFAQNLENHATYGGNFIYWF